MGTEDSLYKVLTDYYGGVFYSKHTWLHTLNILLGSYLILVHIHSKNRGFSYSRLSVVTRAKMF